MFSDKLAGIYPLYIVIFLVLFFIICDLAYPLPVPNLSPLPPPPFPTMNIAKSNLACVETSVVDPHHVDADPDSTYHPDADPHSDFYLMRMRIQDPDPTFQPDADPDPDPSFHLKAKTLEKVPVLK